MYTCQNLKTGTAALAFTLAGIALTPVANVANAGKPGGTTPSYLVTDLGAAATSSAELALNNPTNSRLQIAGVSNLQPAVWTVDAPTGTPLSLDVLPSIGVANAVNDAGYAVGDVQDNNGAWQSFVNAPGLGVVYLPQFGLWTNAIGINNVGEIVGWYHATAENPFGLLWRIDGQGNSAAPIDLGTFAPHDINDWGLMAGTRWVTPNFGVPAMAWFQDGQLVVQDLPGTEGKANAVNNAGQIVGWASNGRSWRATLWDPAAGTTTDLGSLGGSSFALGINDLGQVVGYSLTRRADARACLWKNGNMVDLNSPAGTGGALFLASGINNAGHIVGKMYASSGQDWFLLTPEP